MCGPSIPYLDSGNIKQTVISKISDFYTSCRVSLFITVLPNQTHWHPTLKNNLDAKVSVLNSFNLVKYSVRRKDWLVTLVVGNHGLYILKWCQPTDHVRANCRRYLKPPLLHSVALDNITKDFITFAHLFMDTNMING